MWKPEKNGKINEEILHQELKEIKTWVNNEIYNLANNNGVVGRASIEESNIS